jgi:hypothetical protein
MSPAHPIDCHSERSDRTIHLRAGTARRVAQSRNIYGIAHASPGRCIIRV